MIRKIICTIVFILLFSFSVGAESTDDFYSQQYEISGAEDLSDALPDETREFMDENGISPSDPDFVNSLNPENVFSHIWGFVTSGAKAPLTAGAVILAVILISAAIESGSFGSAAEAAKYATLISAAAVIAVPVSSVIAAGVNAMKGCSVFMTSFVPVFAVVTAASGSAATSASMSALLLGAAQGVSFISNFAVMPLMGGYLAISIASSVSPVISRSGIADGIKKLAYWIMSLTSTVFIGVLSIQTVVNGAADGLTLRTAKFIIGSSVPVAGTALSEALTTVTASMGVLKATVGIYGVIACFIIILPLLVELLLWRLMLNITSSVSDLFSLSGISVILRSVDTVMSVLTGIILLTGAIFIISLTVVVGVTK